jgi:FkbH-like protein
MERDLVRRMLPQVAVPELPEDPALYARTLAAAGYFESIAFSAEDRERAEMYQSNARRVTLQKQAGDLDSYLASLEMEIVFAPFDRAGRARISQLINKSNQFNLTTRRYSEQQINELARRPDCHVLSIRVKDRYSDNGLVGVAITRDRDDACEIDTFLLSCRVIGRGVETAFLAHLAGEARLRGKTRLEGWFLPTKKNSPACEFYSTNGFQMIRSEPQGALWALDLQDEAPWPDWIERLTAAEAGS